MIWSTAARGDTARNSQVCLPGVMIQQMDMELKMTNQLKMNNMMKMIN